MAPALSVEAPDVEVDVLADAAVASLTGTQQSSSPQALFVVNAGGTGRVVLREGLHAAAIAVVAAEHVTLARIVRDVEGWVAERGTSWPGLCRVGNAATTTTTTTNPNAFRIVTH